MATALRLDQEPEQGWGNQEIDWELLIARLKSWGWAIGTKLVYVPIYWTVMTAGLLLVIPTMSPKLYTISFCKSLRDFEETRSLTIAHVFSLILLLGVWLMWGKLVRFWLGDEESFKHRRFRSDRSKLFVMVVGMVVIGFDAWVFYRGIAEWKWGGEGLSWAAAFATAAFTASLTVVIYVGILLKQAVNELKESHHDKEH